MTRVVVIGVGNRWRRDDGAGLRVIEVARPRLPASVDVVVLDGEPTRVLDAWDGAQLAIVVDAVRSDEIAGTVLQLDADDVATPVSCAPGTHGLGLGDAVRLGRALDRLPERLIAFGIVGADFRDGAEMTPSVSDACGRVAQEILALVGASRDAIDVIERGSD